MELEVVQYTDKQVRYIIDLIGSLEVKGVNNIVILNKMLTVLSHPHAEQDEGVETTTSESEK